MSNLSITEISAKIREEVNLYKADYRVDNSAFLIWFLRNIFKLTELESVDAVVDGPRDKGIDAIWVNEQENEIYEFQSEFSPSNERHIQLERLKCYRYELHVSLYSF